MDIVVKEFKRWLAAKPKDRPAIIRDQWALGLLMGPYLPVPAENPFDALTPCGLRLGDCTGGDLANIGEWVEAINKEGERRGIPLDSVIPRRALHPSDIPPPATHRGKKEEAA
jgi:hypothetical protein